MVADTPGQIEIFTWSASGAIVTEAFASTFPTVIAYIVDTPRCVGPQTFMTNMLQVGGVGGWTGWVVCACLTGVLARYCWSGIGHAWRDAVAVAAHMHPGMLASPHTPPPPPAVLPPACAAPQACSILYKSRLPVLLVFNKVDVARHEFALDWMADFENFGKVRRVLQWQSGSWGADSETSVERC